MTKKECILPFYRGNLEYAIFLLNTIYDTDVLKSEILLKENINAAKMGFIANILLAIKEDLVQEEANYNFKSKIFVSELENVVSLIATVADEGYKINGVLFKDAPSLVAELRNKIAHGNYVLDFAHNRIIIKKDDKDIRINIDKLQLFIMKAFCNYEIKVNEKSFERDIVVYDKLDVKNGVPAVSVDDIINLIRKFNKITFTLSSKDNAIISPYLINEVKLLIRKYKNSLDNSILYDFKRKVSPEYDFKWEITKIKKYDQLKDLANTALTVLPSDIDYVTQIKNVGSLVQRYMGSEYDNFGLIASNVKNLILLNRISEINTVNRKTLFSSVGREYSDFSIDYDMLGSSLMAMFDSLFAYANDDIYQKEDFDYSKLDLSLLNVEVLKIDTSLLDKINMQINSESKEYNEIMQLITTTKNNLKRIDSSNTKVLNKLNSKLISLNAKLFLVKSKKDKLIIEKDDILKNYDRNELNIRNSFIIERIRNSFAHGNYKLHVTDSYENSFLVFEDLYRGELKFRASIKLVDFISLLDNNSVIVEEFINKESGRSRG